ncbi:MAG: 2-oxoacid:acceptor oxidoreductase family protein [Thermodesulfobacteriota bacterium]
MYEIILCGRGGQGIVFLTRLIGDIATERGLGVISSETHGMAVRGGSINSHLRIGPFYSPLIREGRADVLVSLDPAETANNVHFLKPGGVTVENSPGPDDSAVRRIDASRLAREIGRVQLENVVVLGFASTLAGFPVSSEEIAARLSKDPRETVRAMNLKALELGAAFGSGRA